MKIGGEYRIDHISRYMSKLLVSMVSSVVRAFERIALLPDTPMSEPLFSAIREQVDKRIRQIEK
jgi:hypothetical protein